MIFCFNKLIVLRLLYVDSNKIGVEGAEHLASFIMQSSCIEEVFLSSNLIADEGALAMAKVNEILL